MNETKPVILVIDFANVAFGCWYSRPEFNEKGENVNAVLKFFQRLKSFKDIFNPTYLVFANDLGRDKTFRRRMYPDYKGTRKEVDPDIKNQTKMISKLCGLLGLPFINNELYEADDIAGMISRWGDSHGFNTVIVTSDRDLYQLVTENTTILSPKKNEFIDVNYILDNYGLTPEQWTDLKILQGDSGDNIPGIKGIGNKTALDLMNRYGSVDNIYAHLDDFSEKLREKLTIGWPTIPLMRDLVTIVTDYKLINLTEEMLWRRSVMTNDIESIIYNNGLHALYPAMYFGLYPQRYDMMEVH